MRLLLAVLILQFVAAAQNLTVADSSGAPVDAAVTLSTPSGAVLYRGRTSAGRLTLPNVPAGSYLLELAAPGLEPVQTVYRAGDVSVTLQPATIRTTVNVLAARGFAEEEKETASLVAVRRALPPGPAPTIGNALEALPGIMIQQSTYGQVSPFLRGLTGYQVLNLVDGVRFNNSTFRSGPNQYLAFVEPGQARQVEVALGPAGATYGSDAMGGAIQVITPRANFASRGGELTLFGATADRSGGFSARYGIGGENAAWLAGVSGRRHNDLRAGAGLDSRNVFHRLFGLPLEDVRSLLGDTLQDTGFSQYGAHTRLSLRLPRQNNVSLWYQNSNLEGVRGYKDLYGGLGRVQSDFEPQRLHFLYGRWERLALGPLASLSATVSLNSQYDGSIRRNLRFTDPETDDRVRVNSYGYTVQATTVLPGNQAFVAGAEVYDEHVLARRSIAGREARPLYPNGSRYTTFAGFAQDTVQWQRLRLQGGLRLTGIRFESPNSPLVPTFGDLTFNASALYQATRHFSLIGIASRGFRAPNLNDIGAIGLNDLGYEIPVAEALGAGVLLADNAGESALPTGRGIAALGPERLMNYELGVRFEAGRFYARVHGFDAELYDPIVRRTLLFPASAPPTSLAGLPVSVLPPTPAQSAAGVVMVATAFDPRGVKAFVNDGQSRYYGLESVWRVRLNTRWSAAGNYSILAGRDLNPNRPIRRLPPQQGLVALRYTPSGRRPWFEVSGVFSGQQRRLSGGDLDDERIGASRRRRDIADFFNGSLAAPFLAGGRFSPTGETLLEIQNRVLPGVDDNTRVPLLRGNPGWATLNVTAGYPLGERLSLQFAFTNITDANYRVHGSGADSPGRNAWLGLRWLF
ncbi:MAG: TonB-dependent receptor [Bryobacteraceae bacterium]|nr:TonB-dependent receptor [Bryobacteraceae bacterium]